MRAAICCIAKNENNYIREWVEYHIQLGFSKIFIFDNNDLWGEIFDDLLDDHIHSGKVQVINCRGTFNFQLNAYNDCYQRFGNDFDWIAFFDVDEFLTFPSDSLYKNIVEYLRFVEGKGFDLVHINWMCYGDNNIVDYNTNHVLKRFIRPLDLNKKIDYDFPENNHIKSIVKGGLGVVNYDSVHTPLSDKFNVCDGDGEKLQDNTPFCPYTFKTIYLRHFVTKTISEYIQKAKKGRSDGYYAYPVNRFFLYNEKTPQKELIVNQYLDSLKSFDSTRYFDISDPDISSEEKIEYFTNQNTLLKKQIDAIRSSASYRIGKCITKPFSDLRKFIWKIQ